ncbi:MAG: adenosylcobinamide amidohydrolase [Immundisolibacter sp.]
MTPPVAPELWHHPPLLVWRLSTPRLALSSAPVGGGLAPVSWVLNAQVPPDYARTDLDVHVAELAAVHDLTGRGCGLLTAARVAQWRRGSDGGVTADATVGLARPTWAADADDAIGPWQVGTINIVIQVPVRLGEAALVGAVISATEAKAQALREAGIPGTGTATDAVCVLCPPRGAAESFAGPRALWGARLARAVHAAVCAGMDGLHADQTP